jgi:ribosomal protein S18 acetylase RimI-like enzyme
MDTHTDHGEITHFGVTEDAGPVVALWEEVQLLRPWNNPRADIQRALTCPTSTLLVARTQHTLIGTAMAGYDGHRGWIYYVAVRPTYQQQGYGTKLIHAAEHYLKAQGAPKLLLMVRNDNTHAQTCYTRLGYTTEAVTVMEKWL